MPCFSILLIISKFFLILYSFNRFLFPIFTSRIFDGSFYFTILPDIPPSIIFGYSLIANTDVTKRFSTCYYASLIRIFANGCLLYLSTKLIISHNSLGVNLLSIYSTALIDFACVNKVPVLSKIIAFNLFKFSNKLFFLIRIPSFIARFKVIATTLGIARPKAHGQLITTIYE